ncbi:hypothetical protein LJR129_005226 [Acidovorax sp. LjRoot129]|uniref:hypothetical protein n=1 Tax=Acidovorax sp. LjRoot129 TaxID=3342260 RepID=UPI003ED14FD4
MTHTAIIYTVGQTHRLYIDLTPEEAEKRWQQVRDNMSDGELVLEIEHGYKVQRTVLNFTDTIEIWGNAGDEFQELA